MLGELQGPAEGCGEAGKNNLQAGEALQLEPVRCTSTLPFHPCSGLAEPLNWRGERICHPWFLERELSHLLKGLVLPAFITALLLSPL